VKRPGRPFWQAELVKLWESHRLIFATLASPKH
jgi:hypothetical protein